MTILMKVFGAYLATGEPHSPQTQSALLPGTQALPSAPTRHICGRFQADSAAELTAMAKQYFVRFNAIGSTTTCNFEAGHDR